MTTATSSNVTITAGTATKLVFTTQPVGGVNEGTNFATQPKVTVEDANGNTVTTDTGAVALSVTSYTAGNGGSNMGTLACTPASPINAVAGVATFANCQITGTAAAGTYTLSATRSGLTTATSSNVTITAGTATKLAFTTQPVGGVIVGANFATQPVVSVEDANGNTVTTDTGAVALSIASYTAGNGGTGMGTLACTPASPINAAAGVATFANCQITGTAAAGTYMLSATRSGLTTATSSNVTITAGTATKLAFTTQPVGGANGAAFATQPTLTVEDASGNTVTSSGASITLAIASQPGSGATLNCTSNPLAATGGVAGFAACNIVGQTGSYTLTATSGTLTSATSSAITITVGPATQLVFTTQPVGGVNEGTAFATQPKVSVEDSGGNVVTTDTGAVALSVASYTAGNGGSASGTLACTPASPVNAVAGVATFANCQITGAAAAGTYTLSATRSGLTTATSSNVTITTGTATKLVFTTQPVGGVNEGTNFATQPVVTVEDANGNTVTTDTGAVALAVASYTAGNGGSASGTLACTPASPINAVAGVATFANCQITGTAAAGTYTLSATRSGLTTATSSNVTITTGASSKLVFTTQPSAAATGGTAFATQPKVTVEDANGNTVTTDSSSVSLGITVGTGTSGAALNCTTNPLAAASGVATFAACSINKSGSGYTLTATDGTLTSATSTAITVSVGAAAQVAFTTSPGASTTATAFTTQPVVSVEDAGGNVVTTSTASVTLAVNSGTGTLGACTTNPVTAVAGVATFGGCKITLGTQGAFTLKATATGLTTGTSASFTVAGAATKLGFATSPAASTGGTAFGTQPVVWVEDSSGDLVTTNTTASVTLAINSGTGTLGACTTNPITVTNGVATFGGCKITLGTQGAFTLKATATGLTAGTSSSFTVAGAATKLVFTTQPSSTTAHGTPFTTQPVVSVEDSSGDVVTTSAASIMLAIGTNPGGGTLNCTTNPLAATNGVATFAGCSITAAGTGYTLTATASGLTTATSSAFNLT